jgi:hypothetical protein
MKKLLFLSALVVQTLGFGQILNGNFEDVKPNLLANNWGINFSIQPQKPPKAILA